MGVSFPLQLPGSIPALLLDSFFKRASVARNPVVTAWVFESVFGL